MCQERIRSRSGKGRKGEDGLVLHIAGMALQATRAESFTEGEFGEV